MQAHVWFSSLLKALVSMLVVILALVLLGVTYIENHWYRLVSETDNLYYMALLYLNTCKLHRQNKPNHFGE